MSNSDSFFERIVNDFIKAKHTNYSEECIAYYIDENTFSIEDINDLRNERDEKIKCTIIRHRVSQKVKQSQSHFNRKCIIYLHGLGSSRLQALSLVSHLPKNYCICMFDMSGSGKSQGEHITYGLKESEDIEPVISYLCHKKHMKQFIIWGRSMGAVATLLYTMRRYSKANTQQSIGSSVSQSLKHTIRRSKSIYKHEQEELVTAIVLDSPFHDFRSIAKEIATKKLSIPNFVVDVALNYVDESFSRVLSSSIGPQYNPFLINLNTEIKLSLPIIFLYSQKDEIVPASHCEVILKNIRSKYEKILINQCTHNQTRPADVIQVIFQKLQRYSRQKNYENKRVNDSFSRQSIMNTSMQRKRGIFVYTPSKQLKKTIEVQDYPIIRQSQTIPMQNQENKTKSPTRLRNSLNRRNFVSLQCSRRISSKQSERVLKKAQETISSENVFYMNTIDTQTHKLITKKLTNKQKDNGHSMIRGLKGKVTNLNRRREIKLTHQKYLQ